LKKVFWFTLVAAGLICIFAMAGCGNITSLFKEKEKGQEPISDLAASSIFIDSAEIRAQTIQLINRAQKAIYIELHILNDPEIVSLLAGRSHQGIEVRILLDQWQRENMATVKELKNQNVSVQYYPAQKGQYQRVRYMVIDYQVAVFYSQDWLQSGTNTHSIAIKLTGDTAWNMTKSFREDWEYTTTLALQLPEKITLPEDNITFSLNGGVKQQVLNAINSATKEILIESEQVSYKTVVDALLDARKRGCSVRLILSPSCIEATPDAIAAFKGAGIEVRYYQSPNQQTIKLNTGIFDDKKIIVTNSSWSYYSFVINHEASLAIPSPQAVLKLKETFEQDWNNSRI